MTKSEFPKISFGIIVFNGEPFTRYCLRGIYPFAHEIIVVEGACKTASIQASPRGHSTDGTLETLLAFKDQEDPEKKIRVISKDGFWDEKDDQSRAYAEKATGDFLWQVDIDEFYQPEDMIRIIQLLKDAPEPSGVSFHQFSFWGGIQYISDGWFIRRRGGDIRRIFKWNPEYSYVKHRPPTVINKSGKDLYELNWIHGKEMSRKGIYLYHYSLLFPKQVLEKCRYYDNTPWGFIKGYQQWAENNYLNLKNPYRVHNVFAFPSWLERFKGEPPPQIKEMWKDIQKGKVKVQCRKTDDIEFLLHSPTYWVGKWFLKGIDRVYKIFGKDMPNLFSKAQQGESAFHDRFLKDSLKGN